MAISPKQQVLNDATALLQRVQQFQTYLERKSPYEQMTTIVQNSDQWLRDNGLLLELQDKVEAVRHNIAPNELREIGERLLQIVFAVESINNNQILATSVQDISSEIEGLNRSSRAIDQTQLASLQTRVDEIFEKHRIYINKGNKEAIDAINQTLVTMRQNSYSSRSSRAALVEAQDYAYFVSLFTDKFKDINIKHVNDLAKFKLDPIASFNKALPYFQELTEYRMSVRNSIDDNQRKALNELSNEAITLLEYYCDLQERADEILPEAEKKSEEMRRRFLDAQIEKDPQPLALEDIDISSLNLQDIDPSIFAQLGLEPIPIALGNPHPALKQLDDLLPLLTVDGSYHQLTNACQVLDSMDLKTTFKISNPTEQLIGKRPTSHLYYIQAKESPGQVVPDDFEYGYNAFIGVHPATNDERKRAVQRTIVEVALENLEDAIQVGDGATVTELLKILEKNVKLDAKDRAEGQECVAYNLFGVFYNLHVAARQNNPSLLNPQDPQFKGDFGREAFKLSKPGIDPAIKIDAIAQVRNALKAAWQVK